MRKHKHKHICILLMALLPVFLCACQNENGMVADTPPALQDSAPPPSSAADPPPASPPAQLPDQASDSQSGAQASGLVTISFHYERQSGSASNQFAIWIEDMDGKLVKTLYATRFTVNGGYKNRPDSIALWVEKSGLASMEQSDIDAVTSATPREGTLSYTWDLTDNSGNAVAVATYRFCVEGTLRWKNWVLYAGEIALDGTPATVQAEAAFTYEATGRQPALNDDSPEHSMLSDVVAAYIPDGTP